MSIFTLNLSAVLHLLNLKGAICGFGEEFQTQSFFFFYSINEDLIILLIIAYLNFLKKLSSEENKNPRS